MLADRNLPQTDPWRRPFRTTVAGPSFRVESAGVDGVWGTCDDAAAESRPDWRP